MNLSQNVKCPNCNHSFHLEEVFLKNIQQDVESKYANQIKSNEIELSNLREIAEKSKNESQNLETQFKFQLEQIELKKKNEIAIAIQENEILLRKSLESEKRIALESEKQNIKKQIESENSELIERYRIEAEKANAEIQKSKQFELDNMNLKKQLDNQKLDLEIEFQKKSDLEKENAMALVSKRESEKFEIEFKKLQLQISDKDNQLKSVSKELDEAKRKVEQGSMQIQGETFELVVENYLKTQFKYDNILPVAKGISGADIIHEVINRDEVCGRIIYETKRTKTFNKKDWIDKLKQEQINSKADIAILITNTMPDEETKVVLIEGVWVCHTSSFEGLILAMRDSIIRIDRERNNQSNKDDKAKELYDYLIGTEFNLQIVSIVDAFTSLKNGIDKERNAMERIWKEREKQIEKVTKNTIGIYSSLRGIAGNAIQNVKELELGNEIVEETNDPLQLGF